MGVRDRILDAAEQILKTRGLAGATTKEIARAAECSEGSLYNYFDSKEALLFAVMTERMPGLIPLIKTLHERVGTGELRVTLEEIAQTALAFYARMVPMMGAALATPELRQRLRERGMGPHRGVEGIAAYYLRREQALGRIRPEASPEAAAMLLLGACQQRIMLRRFTADEASEATDEANAAADEAFVKDLVETLLGGLETARA